MKTVIRSIVILIGLTFASCTFTPKQSDSNDNKAGIEYNSAYICPMHCEGSGSDKPGNCPACKMDYVNNPDSVETEQILEPIVESVEQAPEHLEYNCPMHPEEHGSEGYSCSQCGMALEKHKH